MKPFNLDVHAEKITEDLWLLSRNGYHIAFSPLSCFSFEVKPKGVSAMWSHFKETFNPQIADFLSHSGFEQKYTMKTGSEDESFSPAGVVLSLTSGCNLRCVYCYAFAGTETLSMSELTGRTAIDYAVRNAHKIGRQKSRILFHGGGEAMYVWPLLVKLTEYAANRWKDQVRFSMVTNATLITTERANWLKEHEFRLTVSVDGAKSVQDAQRPMYPHGSSFDACYRGMRLLQDRHVDFGIRATLTHQAAGKIEDLVKIAAEFGCGLKLEPFTPVGRGAVDPNGLALDPSGFVDAFMRAEALGGKLGVEVKTTYLKIQTPGENFCAGNGNMFLVTPAGDVSSCSRATQTNDALSEQFFIGKVSETRVLIDPEKVKRLRALKPSNFVECAECFAEWYCRGGCHNSRLNSGGRPETGHCTLARWFIWYDLFRKNNLSPREDLLI